jgi:hypothetical protein
VGYRLLGVVNKNWREGMEVSLGLCFGKDQGFLQDNCILSNFCVKINHFIQKVAGKVFYWFFFG